MRILLWDIDGTLIKTNGAGHRALTKAVSAAPAAFEALKGIRLDGMTDYKIARQLCAAIRHKDAPHHPLEHHAALVERAEMDAVLEQYLQMLEALLQVPQGYEVLPGVHHVLDALEGKALHALGTGNLERGARLKLTPGALWPRFHFGGFGSDAEDRADVLRAAWRKAAAHTQRELGPADFVVIGDTPRDVDAAHAVGMACVAVATGRYTVAELSAHGAEDVLENLAQPDAPQRILTARRP